MTWQMNVDQLLESWLAEGPSELPDRVVDSIVRQLDETQQRRLIWLPGRGRMNRMVFAIGGIAAVVIAIALGGVYLGRNQPGVGTQPTPSPTATETPDQWGCVNYPSGGTYRQTIGTIAVTATVPAGWRVGADDFYLRNGSCLFSATQILKVALVRAVPTDACDWRSTGVPVTTPAAVTEALAAQTGHETIGPTDTTVGGYPASRFELTARADLDPETCAEGLRLTGGSEGEEFGGPDRDETITMYVVDVEGLAMGVYVLRGLDATPAQVAELDAIVASLRFEP